MDPGTATQFRRGSVRGAVGSVPWLAFAAVAHIAAGAENVDFSRDIQPLLAKRCLACHGPDTQEGGLRLDEQAGATATLDSGARAIVAGDSAASEILTRITASDPDVRMPPEGARLAPAQIDSIRRWIDAGAEWKEHWAFRPLVRPDVPTVPGAGNPIDAFIRDGLERRGLPVPQPAAKIAVLRRATYDVTGLPPSEREVRDFLADESPQAWERAVDRLLDSPHYGEQWARHWLDLVRYADTNSFERDGNKPHAWRYRDYVIRSFNDDKPYDRFVIEQLAGDEIANPRPDDLIATGYYRLGIWDDEPADREQARYDWLDDIVSTTGQTFLGLSINCARCHDHKIDPLPQRDYYALLAFFENVTPMGDRHMNPAFIERPIATDAMSDEETRHRAEDLDRRRQEARREISAVEKRIEEQGDQALDDLAKADLAALRNRLKSLDKEHAGIAKALVVSEYGKEPKPTHVFFRGNPHADRTPENRVEPAFPAVLRAPQPEIIPLAGAETTGRRTALAKWIASPDNPLTARVMANRIWQHHFGRGIVRSPNNFGFAGDPPAHPELLDWLAAELVANGWRLKPLHKRILMSDAYRAASAADPAALARDPLNEAFWRFDMRRLTAEEIRDSIHVASGVFNPKMFGPGVYPKITREVMAGQSKPGDGWGTSPPREQARRTIYAHVKRSLIAPIVADFDGADTDTSCPVRFVTTQPTQALGMMNGEFLHEQARVFADRVRREALAEHTQPAASVDQDTAAIVRRALEIALVRPVRDEEVTRGVALIGSLEGRGGERSESRAVGPKWKFKQYGECGKWVSDLFPHIATHVDEIGFLHSMTADSPIHGSAMLQMNSGRIQSGSPCLGSWINYGLGSVNENLPGFVVMLDPTGGPISGAKNWSSGYMPATYQGTLLRSKGAPILDLAPPDDMPLAAQRVMLDSLREANTAHLLSRGDNTELAARIASYELAWKMQEHAPEAVDIARETEGTKRLYGLDNPRTADFGRRCLLARRLVERGVRFIQLYSGGAHNDDNWDAHGDLVKNHEFHAGNTDQPIAALLTDLKRSGLLESTLVIWGGEFGRQPTAEYAEGTGRDHNAFGFTMWMAGGGIKGGVSVGETDELGAAAISPEHDGKTGFHVKSLHATVLHCLGLDPNRLSYFFGGLDQKLVGVEPVGPIKEILA